MVRKAAKFSVAPGDEESDVGLIGKTWKTTRIPFSVATGTTRSRNESSRIVSGRFGSQSTVILFSVPPAALRSLK